GGGGTDVGAGAAVEEFGDEGGPAGLMVCAQALAGVPVKILVEEQMVPEVGVSLLQLVLPEGGAAAIAARQEEADQPLREVVLDLTQRVHMPRAGRVLDGEVVAVVVIEALKCLD